MEQGLGVLWAGMNLKHCRWLHRLLYRAQLRQVFGVCGGVSAARLGCVPLLNSSRTVPPNSNNNSCCPGMSATAREAPSTIQLQPLTQDHIKAVKTLNSVLLPVKYHDRVYEDALACGPVSQLAFEGDKLIGAILCRLEAVAEGAQLYIISLGVLAPYRGQGVGSRLLDESLAQCEGDDMIRRALLHVHSANTEAMDWYQHRGFTVAEVIKDYYKRLEPRDAAVLVKQLNTSVGDGA